MLRTLPKSPGKDGPVDLSLRIHIYYTLTNVNLIFNRAVSRVLCDARILNIFEGAAGIQAQVVCRGLIEGRN